MANLQPKRIAEDIYYLSNWGVNIYFVRSGESWVLIDTGWGNSAGAIMQVAESLFGADVAPSSILLTHAHPDHCGSAVVLAQHWGVPVYVHPDELSLARGELAAIIKYASPLDKWLVLPILSLLGSKRREAALAGSSLSAVVQSFEPGEGVPGLPEWQCVPTPGHTPGHVALFRERDRVLIAGDAVLTAALGGMMPWIRKISFPPRISTWNLNLCKASIVKLAELKPAVLATGHGTPVAGTSVSTKLDGFVRRNCGKRKKS